MARRWPGGSTGSVAATAPRPFPRGECLCMGTRGDEEVVWALSEKDGKELWMKPLGAKLPAAHAAVARGTGMHADRRWGLAVCPGHGRRLACLKAADGEVVWQRSLTKDFGGQVPTWSYRESPLVDGDKVICTPGGPEALLVALNKSTGETIWKSQLPQTGGEGARPRRVQDGGKVVSEVAGWFRSRSRRRRRLLFGDRHRR